MLHERIGTETSMRASVEEVDHLLRQSTEIGYLRPGLVASHTAAGASDQGSRPSALRPVLPAHQPVLHLHALGTLPGSEGVLFLGVTVTADLLAFHASVHATLAGQSAGHGRTTCRATVCRTARSPKASTRHRRRRRSGSCSGMSHHGDSHVGRDQGHQDGSGHIADRITALDAPRSLHPASP